MTNEELRIAIAKAKGKVQGNPRGNWSLHDRTTGELWIKFDRGRAPAYIGYQKQNCPNWPESIADAWALVEEMKRRGHWLKLHSPFTPDDKWFGGFIPHGVTGWNGHPDFGTEEGETSAERVICVGYLAYLSHLDKAEGGGDER